MLRSALTVNCQTHCKYGGDSAKYNVLNQRAREKSSITVEITLTKTLRNYDLYLLPEGYSLFLLHKKQLVLN